MNAGGTTQRKGGWLDLQIQSPPSAAKPPQKTCHFDRSAGGKTGGAEWRNLSLFFGQGGAEHKQRMSSRAGDSIQKPVILSEAEEPLTSAGSGGAELHAATSAREKLEVLRLRSLPPSPAGNSAQNDSYDDAPLRGIMLPIAADQCAVVDANSFQTRLFGKTLMVIGTVGFLGSTAVWIILRHIVLND